MLKHAAPFTLLTLLLASCAQTPTSAPAQERFKVFGMGEIVVGEAAGIQAQNLTQSALQLKSLGNTMVDHNGYRYISTRYQVRNATSAGVASGTAKTNLTLIAGETASTLGNTAIRAIKKADGSAANPSLASLIVPTGTLAAGPVLASGQQSFQVFTSSEIAPLAGTTGLLNAFPYGFVVDRVGGGRTLPANPTVNDYQGTVTVSVKVPLQTPLSNTPTAFTLAVLFAEDSVTQVSESPEEQLLGNSGLAARVTAAGASRVNVFPGSTYSGTTRTLCKIPVSTAGSPSYLVNFKPGVAQVTPDVDVLAESSSYISATFDCADVAAPTLSASTPQNELTIQALQTGKRLTNFNTFNKGTFAQLGSEWTYTPGSGAAFKPNELVEVTLHQSGLRSSFVHRYRVKSAAEGAAGFNTATLYGTGTDFVFNVAVADVDGDGDLDALQSNGSTNSIRFFKGNGNGTFQTAVAYDLGEVIPGVALADVNNDGKPDIVGTKYTSAAISVMLGNGDGTFQTQQTSTGGGNGTALALGDINGDGNLDVVTGNRALNNATTMLGNGDGTFQSGTTLTTGNNVYDVDLGDLNGDGKLDLVIANADNNNVGVFKGNGNGTFQSMVTYPVGSVPTSVAVGDLNADGNLDVVVTNNGAHTISVLLGNGDATLQTQQTYTVTGTNPFPFDVALGDYNGDGKLDAVTSDNGVNDVSLFLGNGDGTLQADTHYSAVFAPTGLAAGDFNGDGKLDLITGSSFSQFGAVVIKK
ncbi:FG-GAP repeat domain-containing protein [Deinococcus roseus]|uniref:VCBS repeat-containing protein n=1 Tax=Deinococcus roseus TaxID=392414 RepID=A0ABQ2DIA0_9DEIO|nr:VCBS repeat-containing protein [Deinococcus roseus]GGJ58568.1 hypothetical protein GCM10008938_50870 [Deinococcus roseus]